MVVHYQVMVTASAEVRSVLTASTVSFTWNAGALVKVWEKK